MEENLNRRQFIRQSGRYGIFVAGTTMIPGITSCSLFNPKAEISVVTGTNYYENTMKAVELVGGISHFVPQGSKVGLLINSDFEIPGTYVNPDIALAALKLIYDAGANEVICLQAVKTEYWQRSAHFDSHKHLVDKLHHVAKNVFPSEYNEDDFERISTIQGSKAIIETEVVKAWLNCDVFINIPICKHHASTYLTGALKNIMGVSTRKSNVSMHLGTGKKNNPENLAQCIADQHLLKKTDLCIVDATEFIVDNGPSGPGTTEKPMKVLAGTDIVALDALSANLLGYSPDEVLCIVKAQETGIGNMNYTKMKVVEYNT